jgi:hypothetical protein
VTINHRRATLADRYDRPNRKSKAACEDDGKPMPASIIRALVLGSLTGHLAEQYLHAGRNRSAKHPAAIEGTKDAPAYIGHA